MSEAGRTRLALVGLVFLLTVVYADPLFTRRNFAGRDLTAYNLPTEKTVHDAYARGHFPVWMPYVSGGRPLLPNPNAGALYPLRILLSPLPFPLEMRVYPLIHWIAAGIGIIVLLRCLGGSSMASWIGAVTYVFSGVVVSEFFFTHIEPGMALFPWIVWTTRRVGNGRAGPLLLLSLLFGLDMLAGDVFTVGLGFVCALLWIVLEEPREKRVRRIAAVAVSLALGSLIAAPQIIATLLWIPETNRAVLGMHLGEALHYSISPWRLLEFFVPYPFGHTWDLNNHSLWGWTVLKRKYLGLFVTLFAGSLATIAITSAWGQRPRGARFARVLFVSTLLLSVLPSLLPDRLGMVFSPLPLRNPEKLAVTFTFALALSAGLFLDRVRAGLKIPRWTIVIGVVLTLVALGARLSPAGAGSMAVALTGTEKSLVPTVGADLSQSFSEGGLLWAATLLALDLLGRKRVRMSVWGLAILTVVPIVGNRRIATTYPEQQIFSPPPFVRFLERRDPAGRYRVLGESMYRPSGRLEAAQTETDLGFLDYAQNNWYQHTQALFRRGTVFNGDFDAGDLARIEALRRISGSAVRFKDSQSFFSSFSLRWGIRYRDQAPVTGYQPIGGLGIRVWDELPSALPDIRLVQHWREEIGSLRALQSLPSLTAGEIVIESDKAARGASRPGSLIVREEEPERLLVDSKTADATWLFVLRDFWNWRRVTVDGREAEVYPAQLAFSAVRIPPGDHRIEWTERFPGLTISGFGPVLFLLIGVLLFLRGRERLPA